MLPVSRETIEKARNVNLAAYLISVGEPLVKEGRNYRLKRHDSLTINSENNLWIWNSREIGGKNAIDYLMKVENKSFLDAVSELTGIEGKRLWNKTRDCHAPPRKKTEFKLPKPAENNRRVFAYLYKQRRILPEVINHFIAHGDLYEDAEHHNAVFVGRNESGSPAFACKRSTNTLCPSKNPDGTKRNNRWDVEGSKKRCGFRHEGTSVRLFVFEAPIDMLSFISLRIIKTGGDWKKDSYLSLDGVSDFALSWFFKSRKDGEAITTVIFCLDNDKAGRSNAFKMCGKYNKSGRTVRYRPPKKGKDYNDNLKILTEEGKVNG